MTTAEAAGPLHDCRVLELGSVVAGPFCGRLLADFGAEVVKVEIKATAYAPSASATKSSHSMRRACCASELDALEAAGVVYSDRAQQKKT